MCVALSAAEQAVHFHPSARATSASRIDKTKRSANAHAALRPNLTARLTLLRAVQRKDRPSIRPHVTRCGSSVVPALVKDAESVARLCERSRALPLLVLVRVPRDFLRVTRDALRGAHGVGEAVLAAIGLQGERRRTRNDVGEVPAKGDEVVLRNLVELRRQSKEARRNGQVAAPSKWRWRGQTGRISKGR